MKILLLGSGALKIGQAGEFDYSGSQAIKALKEEGIKVILINPNIATIQTSQDFADSVYFLPIVPYFVEQVIRREKPQSIILSFGGQTALNCGLALAKKGILKKYKVRVFGTPIDAIEKTEDRHLFNKTLTGIGLKIPTSIAVNSPTQAVDAAKKIGYPVMVRGAFSLGGQDSGVVTNKGQLLELAKRALAKSPQILVEEYLAGWKEVEYEVVRDRFDNCITVCNMENIDPMGIHTGESIVVAPSQTLNNFEYHMLRSISIQVSRHLNIVGECNIQFALNPKPHLTQTRTSDWTSLRQDPNKLDYRVIEVNARLSRSSALASKATGYPLAYVAAKLALGCSLIDLKNSVTKKTIACFEPALDYLVVKIPRWDLGKFLKSGIQIGTSMQSVGEVMAIGRKFEEAIQKAVRMLDIGFEGILDEKIPQVGFAKPTPWRLFAVAKAIRIGTAVSEIAKKTNIDPFFLEKIKSIVRFEQALSKIKNHNLGAKSLKRAKQLGFSDNRIAMLTRTSGEKIRQRRQKLKILPHVKQIDTLAAEYPAQTNYLYLTYNGEEDDVENFKFQISNFKRGRIATNQKHDPSTSLRVNAAGDRRGRALDSAQSQAAISTKSKLPKDEHWREGNSWQDPQIYNSSRAFFDGSKTGRPQAKVIVLGSGPYRIGSSVEFDWCSVTCAQTATHNNLETIVVNCNPETVSTDYDMANRLYFEELTLETVLEIYQKENPKGVIISMGGQTPNNLAIKLAAEGVKILGTSASSVDRAEDRNQFSKLCDQLGISQPIWAKLENIKSAVGFAQKIGYPVLVRPSYVLSGFAMNVAFTPSDLTSYLELASQVSSEYPVVISKFYQNAKELEIDAVARYGQVICQAITEHIENAGIHSGDSTIVLPPQKLYIETTKQVEQIARKIASVLKITGPFNIQFLAENNKVMVIECNLRASRSFPFVSKVTGVNFAKIATEAMLGPQTRVTREGAPRRAPAAQANESLINHRFFQSEDVGRGKSAAGPALKSYVAVKSPQFSFGRIKGADPILRVEMASTGEVACFGDDIYEAFLKSLIATGVDLPEKSVFISLAGDENKAKFLESARILAGLNLKIYATHGTSKFLKSHGVISQKLYKIHERKNPNVLDFLNSKKIDLVINIFDPYFKREFDDDYLIRRATIDFGIELLTNLQTAELFVKAIATKKFTDLKALPWNYYVTPKD